MTRSLILDRRPESLVDGMVEQRRDARSPPARAGAGVRRHADPFPRDPRHVLDGVVHVVEVDQADAGPALAGALATEVREPAVVRARRPLACVLVVVGAAAAGRRGRRASDRRAARCWGRSPRPTTPSRSRSLQALGGVPVLGLLAAEMCDLDGVLVAAAPVARSPGARYFGREVVARRCRWTRPRGCRP